MSVLGPNCGKPLTHAMDNFKPGASFEEVLNFYVFDKKLRSLATDALERIEIALRAQISTQIGGRDKWAHRNSGQLDGRFCNTPSNRLPQMTRHGDWLKSQDSNFLRSKEDFAKHFRSKYHGDPPVWIASEVWDWGMLSHFYDGLRIKDKDAIAALYGDVTGREMATWIRALNDLRNICAHHSRFWNRGLVVTLRMPPVGNAPELDHFRADVHSTSRAYGVLAVMVFMLKSLYPATTWHRRVVDHVLDAPRNPIIGPVSAGFPVNWEQQGIWQI